MSQVCEGLPYGQYPAAPENVERRGGEYYTSGTYSKVSKPTTETEESSGKDKNKDQTKNSSKQTQKQTTAAPTTTPTTAPTTAPTEAATTVPTEAPTDVTDDSEFEDDDLND